MAEDKKIVDLGLLEQDDEFEEFPAEEWDTRGEDQTNVNVWEDNWDDDLLEDDFAVQLSKMHRKRSLIMSPDSSSSTPRAKKNRESSPPKLDTFDDLSDPTVQRGRRGRPSRSSSRSSSANKDEVSLEGRTPTRSSARIRNAHK